MTRAARKTVAKGRGEPRTTARAAARPPAPAPVLRGPAGGSWTFVDGGPHGGPLYCGVCQTFHQAAWCYVVGIIAYNTVCEGCAEGMVNA